MVSSIFPSRLRGLIAQALGSSSRITRSEIDTLWTGFGDGGYPPGDNKLDKANALVRHIGQSLNADDLFLDLLNHVYYTSGEGNRRRQDAEAFKPLLVELLRRGFTIDEDEGLQKPSGVKHRASAHVPGREVPSTDRTVAMEKIGDGRSVFIVHGRNTQAKDEMIKFLRHLDAKPITWTQAASDTGKASPTTMEIINAGMAKAQAIVVIFTPDDEAQLKPAFVKDDDGLHETQLTGQARDISDVAGINWIDLGDAWENRERLRGALVNANVTLESNRDLVSPDAGTFTGIALG
ncbi:TIR domain-containing protein [Pseudarthrobacter chlorophenolicus]|uniref:TIR domain-containing protein n=1 Tax=Pseudarthrobacter chlorophenolicus TaxID=85085 RepID=UPI0009E2BCE8|nr:TIR domain-containing protein [Pseudarthrobacter chlorophenolicus]